LKECQGSIIEDDTLYSNTLNRSCVHPHCNVIVFIPHFSSLAWWKWPVPRVKETIGPKTRILGSPSSSCFGETPDLIFDWILLIDGTSIHDKNISLIIVLAKRKGGFLHPPFFPSLNLFTD